MTNLTHAFPAMPSATEMDCLAPRRRDYVRIAWWMVKGMRFRPVINFVLPVLLILAVIAAVCWAGWSVFALLLILAALLVVPGSLVCGFSAVVVLMSAGERRRFYMDPGRKAVLLLIERPGVGSGSGEWKIEGHIVAKTAEGYGAALRERMIPLAQAVAGPSDVVICGQAANEKVMAIYLAEGFGFRDMGNGRIEWRNGW